MTSRDEIFLDLAVVDLRKDTLYDSDFLLPRVLFVIIVNCFLKPSIVRLFNQQNNIILIIYK